MNQINAKAGLRIMGKGLDLKAITVKIDIAPTHTHQEGEAARAGEKYQQDMWILNSPLEARKGLDAHLRWLVKQLKPHYEYLRSLKANAKIDIFCSYTSEGEQGGFSLSPQALSIFAELGIKLELSLITLSSKEQKKSRKTTVQ